jgi:hypothetical protein
MAKITCHEENEESAAWARFEHAVDAAVKSGPKHKIVKPPNSPEKMKDAKDANDKRDSGDDCGGNSCG